MPLDRRTGQGPATPGATYDAPTHPRQPPAVSDEGGTNGTCSSSAARCLARSPRRSYRAVVAGLECPAWAWTVAMSAPASSKSPTNVRRLCRVQHNRSYAG
jgi:hypothetical protein